jgi:O-antigen ligase
MFKDHVWTGVGNGNYLEHYYEYVLKHKEELDLSKTQFTVHNSYIKMLAELGILGGLSFIGVYFSLAGLVIKVYRKSSGPLKTLSLAFLGFWGAYLFHNFFNNLMFIPQLNVFVWIFTAGLYKYYLLEMKEVTA